MEELPEEDLLFGGMLFGSKLMFEDEEPPPTKRRPEPNKKGRRRRMSSDLAIANQTVTSPPEPEPTSLPESSEPCTARRSKRLRRKSIEFGRKQYTSAMTLISDENAQDGENSPSSSQQVAPLRESTDNDESMNKENSIIDTTIENQEKQNKEVEKTKEGHKTEENKLDVVNEEEQDVVLDETVKSLYLNKNFQWPTQKSWTTIFESPQTSKTGNDSLTFGKRKMARTIAFENLTTLKLKKRQRKAKQNGWKPKRITEARDKAMTKKIEQLDDILRSPLPVAPPSPEPSTSKRSSLESTPRVGRRKNRRVDSELPIPKPVQLSPVAEKIVDSAEVTSTSKSSASSPKIGSKRIFSNQNTAEVESKSDNKAADSKPGASDDFISKRRGRRPRVSKNSKTAVMPEISENTNNNNVQSGTSELEVKIVAQDSDVASKPSTSKDIISEEPEVLENVQQDTKPVVETPVREEETSKITAVNAKDTVTTEKPTFVSERRRGRPKKRNNATSSPTIPDETTTTQNDEIDSKDAAVQEKPETSEETTPVAPVEAEKSEAKEEVQKTGVEAVAKQTETPTSSQSTESSNTDYYTPPDDTKTDVQSTVDSVTLASETHPVLTPKDDNDCDNDPPSDIQDSETQSSGIDADIVPDTPQTTPEFEFASPIDIKSPPQPTPRTPCATLDSRPQFDTIDSESQNESVKLPDVFTPETTRETTDCSEADISARTMSPAFDSDIRLFQSGGGSRLDSTEEILPDRDSTKDCAIQTKIDDKNSTNNNGKGSKSENVSEKDCSSNLVVTKMNPSDIMRSESPCRDDEVKSNLNSSGSSENAVLGSSASEATETPISAATSQASSSQEPEIAASYLSKFALFSALFSKDC